MDPIGDNANLRSLSSTPGMFFKMFSKLHTSSTYWCLHSCAWCLVNSLKVTRFDIKFYLAFKLKILIT